MEKDWVDISRQQPQSRDRTGREAMTITQTLQAVSFGSVSAPGCSRSAVELAYWCGKSKFPRLTPKINKSTPTMLYHTCHIRWLPRRWAIVSVCPYTPSHDNWGRGISLWQIFWGIPWRLQWTFDHLPSLSAVTSHKQGACLSKTRLIGRKYLWGSRLERTWKLFLTYSHMLCLYVVIWFWKFIITI